MTEKEKLQKAIDLGKSFCPTYKIVPKNTSTLHKTIGWIFSKIGNKDYMTNYGTTIHQITAFPDAWLTGNELYIWQIALHEIQHAQDAQKVSNIVFDVGYLLPQLIGILGVLYSITILPILLLGGPLWPLWGLMSLLFLAPVPAFGRAYIEIRGYTVSIAVDYWSGTLGDESDYLDWIVSHFSDFSYYRMWPFKKWVRSYFSQKLQELKAGTFQLTPYLAACKNLCKTVNS
jgi:hypothetical protein